MFRKYDLNFFTSFVDIFNQVVIPNWAQVTHHKSTRVYFYIVYCVHYDEVKKILRNFNFDGSCVGEPPTWRSYLPEHIEDGGI